MCECKKETTYTVYKLSSINTFSEKCLLWSIVVLLLDADKTSCVCNYSKGWSSTLKEETNTYVCWEICAEIHMCLHVKCPWYFSAFDKILNGFTTAHKIPHSQMP